MAPPRPQPALQAALWHNRLTQLGITLPLCVTHDLGWLLSLPGAERAPATLLRPLPDESAGYHRLMRDLVDSTQPLGDLQLPEGLLVALLSRLLGPLSRRYARTPDALLISPGELPVTAATYPVRGQHGAPSPPAAVAFQRFLCEHALTLLTEIELLDVATLRMLVQSPLQARPSLNALDELHGEAMLSTPDLLSVLQAPDVRDIVRFSQELLPSVLEHRASTDRQHYPVGGHASLERRGSLDSLLGSELAHDDTLLLHRLAEGEALYYGRERPPDERPGSVQILVDASASMRGQRQIFARGLALALAKRLSLRGDALSLRFFDGRLHSPLPMSPPPPANPAQTAAQSALLGLLLFRCQRGRNYRRVFEDLLRELRGVGGGRVGTVGGRVGTVGGRVGTVGGRVGTVGGRVGTVGGRVGTVGGVSGFGGDTGSSGDGAVSRPTLYVLTHGECHIPSKTVQELAAVVDLYAVFVLPSGELSIDYLPWLRGYHVVADDALSQPEERRRRAIGILDVAAAAATAARTSRRS